MSYSCQQYFKTKAIQRLLANCMHGARDWKPNDYYIHQTTFGIVKNYWN